MTSGSFGSRIAWVCRILQPGTRMYSDSVSEVCDANLEGGKCQRGREWR